MVRIFGELKIKCWMCGSIFVPTEMDYVPNFLCKCGALNSNPFFGRKGFGRRYTSSKDWHTHSRNVGGL